MSLRILIVEDEPLIVLDLRGIFEEAGHTVVGIAIDMHRALQIAAQHPRLDLAIMDIDLAGGTNGITTAQRLRQDYNVASLFVSARIDDETRARATEWSPVGFIGKPFHEAQILNAIQNIAPRA